jgi:hypothetical protein
MLTYHTVWASPIMLAALVALGVCYAFYGSGRKMRDPRLDRDYSDDEPAPCDAPASLSPEMDQYMRMLDEDHPPNE